MKKTLEMVLFTIALICGCPFIVSRMVSGQDGLAMMFVLLFIINPIYCIVVGIAAGKDIFNCLIYPLIIGIVFVAGYMVIFNSNDSGLYFYGLIYLVISSISMFITFHIEKKRK